MFHRYAIFYTPPQGAFAEFCASWLGWNSRTGLHTDQLEVDGIDLRELTKTPRKYGMHGTLKAPFYLAKGYRPDDLVEAFRLFALTRAPVEVGQLSLQHKNGFLALRPVDPASKLNVLARDIVKSFDNFRAPLGQRDLARRRKVGLTPEQDKNLVEWGYPFIFDDFHFHMTLSGKLDDPTAQNVMDRLNPLIRPLTPDPLRVDCLTLMAQDGQGMFHEIHRYSLAG